MRCKCGRYEMDGACVAVSDTNGTHSPDRCPSISFAPAASDLARAVEALEAALMYAEARERDGLPCAARLHPNHARTLLAALRSREQEIAPSSMVPVADANAAILRLQRRLDAVRPVVKAAVEFTAHPDQPLGNKVDAAVDALPAADREWALKGE